MLQSLLFGALKAGMREAGIEWCEETEDSCFGLWRQPPAGGSFANTGEGPWLSTPQETVEALLGKNLNRVE